MWLLTIATINDGVSVEPSKLEGNAGFGLFAQRDFKRGDRVTEYVGHVVSYDAAKRLRNKRQASHVVSVSSQCTCIDGIKQPRTYHGGASFANDASRQLGLAGNNTKNYTWYDRQLGRTRCFLQATKAIQIGDEICLGYQNSYWVDVEEEDQDPTAPKLINRKRFQPKPQAPDPNSLCENRRPVRHKGSSDRRGVETRQEKPLGRGWPNAYQHFRNEYRKATGVSAGVRAIWDRLPEKEKEVWRRNAKFIRESHTCRFDDSDGMEVVITDDEAFDDRRKRQRCDPVPPPLSLEPWSPTDQLQGGLFFQTDPCGTVDYYATTGEYIGQDVWGSGYSEKLWASTSTRPFEASCPDAWVDTPLELFESAPLCALSTANPLQDPADTLPKGPAAPVAPGTQSAPEANPATDPYFGDPIVAHSPRVSGLLTPHMSDFQKDDVAPGLYFSNVSSLCLQSCD
ncbi:MAG: uncharacterized protein KVP18_000380 [Porospora cf. gigantea A]|nr:MAG: hypothetical protein KVP18_000380 [Porospora cf. gigantea A]